jgi:hypothetical protein
MSEWERLGWLVVLLFALATAWYVAGWAVHLWLIGFGG